MPPSDLPETRSDLPLGPPEVRVADDLQGGRVRGVPVPKVPDLPGLQLGDRHEASDERLGSALRGQYGDEPRRTPPDRPLVRRPVDEEEALAALDEEALRLDADCPPRVLERQVDVVDVRLEADRVMAYVCGPGRFGGYERYDLPDGPLEVVEQVLPLTPAPVRAPLAVVDPLPEPRQPRRGAPVVGRQADRAGRGQVRDD